MSAGPRMEHARDELVGMRSALTPGTVWLPLRFSSSHYPSSLVRCSFILAAWLASKVFAPNEVTGASQFWYLMHQMRKMKKTTGEILDIVEVRYGHCFFGGTQVFFRGWIVREYPPCIIV